MLVAVLNDWVTDTNDTSERLDFIRSIDQVLAARHHLGLRYPPRQLILALSLMAQGKTVDQAVKKSGESSIGNAHMTDLEIEPMQSR